MSDFWLGFALATAMCTPLGFLIGGISLAGSRADDASERMMRRYKGDING